jgi:nucleoside-diphosphate-sugar epimerase
MKKILIVGGAGYIGTRLSNHLFGVGYDVTVLDLFWFGNFLDDGINKINKNLWDLKSEDLKNFDCVLVLSGLANDPMAMFRPDLNFKENAAAPAYLAYISKQANIKKFIYASSCSVYGYTKNEMLTETSIIKPEYPYGISKLQSEYGIMVLEDNNFKPVIFRKGTVGGWSSKMRFDLVVNTMVKNAIVDKKITINNPNLWRPLIDIRDVISAYQLAIEQDQNISGIFNLSGSNMTIGDLGKQISNFLNHQGIENKLVVNNVNDLRNYKANIQKITDILDFNPKYTPIDSVIEIIKNISFLKNDFNNDLYYNINVFKKILTGTNYDK